MSAPHPDGEVGSPSADGTPRYLRRASSSRSDGSPRHHPRPAEAGGASLVQTLSIPVTEDVFSLQLSPDGVLLALGLGNGSVDIHDATDGTLLRRVQADAEATRRASYPLTNVTGLPITALRWRPPLRGAPEGGARHVLLAAGGDGTLRHIHATSGRVLHTLMEEGNQVFACDFRSDGAAFASAGKDKAVRVYDEATRKLVVTMSTGSGEGGSLLASQREFASSTERSPRPNSAAAAAAAAAAAHPAMGHSNRVFSVLFHPSSGGDSLGPRGVADDVNILASGGWDNTVQVWDVRCGCAVRSIYGPHIAADGLTFSADGKYLFSASWRANTQLQMWDWASGELVYNVPWTETNEQLISRSLSHSEDNAPPPNSRGGGALLYSAGMSVGAGGWGGAYLVAGGSGSNEAKIFSVPQLIEASSAFAAHAPPGSRGSGRKRSIGTIAGMVALVSHHSHAHSAHSHATGVAASVGAGADAAKYPHLNAAVHDPPNEVAAVGVEKAKAAHASALQPLVATVKNLARGVYATGWGPGGVFALGGGDQPVTLYQLGLPGGGGGWPLHSVLAKALVLDHHNTVGTDVSPRRPSWTTPAAVAAQGGAAASADGALAPNAEAPAAASGEPAPTLDVPANGEASATEGGASSTTLASPQPKAILHGSAALRAVSHARDAAAGAATEGAAAAASAPVTSA